MDTHQIDPDFDDHKRTGDLFARFGMSIKECVLLSMLHQSKHWELYIIDRGIRINIAKVELRRIAALRGHYVWALQDTIDYHKRECQIAMSTNIDDYDPAIKRISDLMRFEPTIITPKYSSRYAAALKRAGEGDVDA